MTDPRRHVQNIHSTLIVNEQDEGAEGDEVEEEDEEEDTKRLVLVILRMTEEIRMPIVLLKIMKPPN